MGRRTYSEAEKAEALALYETAGPTAVQATLGIPKQRVTQWAKADGIRTVRNETMIEARDAAMIDWDVRRVRMAHHIGSVAEQALEQTEQDLAEGRIKGKDAAVTMAILVDKAQLLTGAATSRTAHLHADGDAKVLLDELAERRAHRAA